MTEDHSAQVVELIVGKSDAGERLDRFVAEKCEELSRARVQELIEAGLVLVNGAAAKAAHKLREGERVTVQAVTRAPLRAEAEEIPLDVLYEDDDVVAVNKPAGMMVHAGAGNSRGTLVNALLGRGQALARGGDALRPGIVHRLDKETSGVVIVAKNDFAHAKLSEAFQARNVKKTYLALVHRAMEKETGRIEWPIGRDPVRRTRMKADLKGKLNDARAARTDWKVLARLGGEGAADSTTLLEVQLHTGRTHQIRVHLAAMKHPIVGDTLYGAPAQVRLSKNVLMAPLGRNFLHAAKLGFAQPRTGGWIEVKAPLPSELHQFLRELAGAAASEIDATLRGYL